ncbi:uncharacterized protein PGTG_11695 [Puccinia graminis f. sp. tritici CRL 75-36-700-3]|uniref:Uncharacterized protein n=1 Tax=Puccinia graminis f. sp. tritici (strain CRL 75-36-700-3 / race SCCL) TaxID=418459 RepID=E3KNR4_PUCGT|nr:uncharacterized protein PGTG_11695 [Puccinia graminis f. sp. tritici CRL 75-36-700-3]EFP85939.1 hypothetical protein PGTG_11695 [Puccinia graminis f. sp. tritici CRL 75-36-700-3]
MKTLLISYSAFVLTKSTTLVMIPNSNQRTEELSALLTHKLFDLNEPATEEPSPEHILSSGSSAHPHVTRPTFDLNLPCRLSGEELPPRMCFQEHMGSKYRDRWAYLKRKGDHQDLGFDQSQSQFLSNQRQMIHLNTARHLPDSSVMNELTSARAVVSGNVKRPTHNLRNGFPVGNREQRLNGNLPEPFDVYDWDYVREVPDSEIRDGVGFRLGRPLHQLLMFLDSLRYKPTRDLRFSISDGEERSILRSYQQSKKLLYPPGLTRGARRGALWKIAMSVSNSKIAVDRYDVFSLEIIGSLRAGLTHLGETAADLEYPISPSRINAITGYVENLTKVATFFIIAYLSLFKKHPTERLSTQLVEEILIFLKKFWEDTQNSKSELRKNHEWSTLNAIVLKSEEIDRNPKSYKHWLNGNACYQMAWKMAMYWVKENGKWFGVGLEDEDLYENSIFDLLNKIIIYANYQNPKSFLHYWGDKKIE